MSYQNEEPKNSAEKEDEGPLSKFANELMAVFCRWHEESELDEEDMEQAAQYVINQFCGKTLEFEPDSEFLNKLEEDYDGD